VAKGLEQEASVANSTCSTLRQGLCRWVTSDLKSPITVSARALSQLSPTVPTDGAMPAAASRSVYRTASGRDRCDVRARRGPEIPAPRRWRVTQLGNPSMSAAVLLREDDSPDTFVKTAAEAEVSLHVQRTRTGRLDRLTVDVLAAIHLRVLH
jgi:hypothetical protein